MTVHVIRSEDRSRWRVDWLDSRQSFPVTGNFDLAAHAHGLLMVHNQDTVGPGEGFDTHRHRDVEIITWVLEGSVLHQDSAGNSGLIYPGLAQRMSAGTGILHSEKNGSTSYSGDRVEVVQMWIPPDTAGITPNYQELDVAAALSTGELVPVASGMRRHLPDAAIGIRNRFATLHAARLAPGQKVTVPDAPFGHVFLARGTATMEGAGPLEAGDAVRLTADGGQRLTALEPAEVLIWEMHAEFE
ncbi:pirin family protein [Tomitella biformata]|uniref:pirin family protein n=1 Tax=Tomitella biformata TaxID=630403 RepID=UPI000465ED45|nr:pirin family protein [Tomitella biformata]